MKYSSDGGSITSPSSLFHGPLTDRKLFLRFDMNVLYCSLKALPQVLSLVTMENTAAQQYLKGFIMPPPPCTQQVLTGSQSPNLCSATALLTDLRQAISPLT